MKETSVKYRLFKDKVFYSTVFTMSFIVTIPLFIISYFILKRGFSALSWEFFYQLPKPMGDIGGGILNGLVGTSLIIIFSSILAIPFGISVGIYLSEFRTTKLANIVRICTEILQSVPSIVLGIIAYIWLVIPMRTFTGLAGSVALAIMMLPVIIRSTEETLKMIPNTYKEAALSLGVPESKTILKVIVPCGLNGIITGVLIGVARIAGETAPLLFTAFGSRFLSFNMLKPIDSLPLMIYKYANSPYPNDNNLAWGIALVLCCFVLMLNLLAKGVTRKWKIQF